MADTSIQGLPGDVSVNSSIDPFQAAAGRAQNSQGISLITFLVSLAGASAIFSIEVAVFLLIKNKFSRI
jgi:hypothetical protein